MLAALLLVLAPLPAEDLIRSGKRAEALAQLEKANPDELWALVQRGRLLERMGRREEAARLFASFPDRVTEKAVSAEDLTALAVGCQEHAARTHDKALLKEVMSELYTRAQKADPQYARARYEAGMLFASKHQYSEAEEEFKAMLESDPKDPCALYGTALTSWGRGDFGGAFKACGAALEADPLFEEALILMADLEIWDEADEEAGKLLAKVMERNPESLEGLALSAASAFVRGEEARGRSLLVRLEGLCPAWPDAFRIVAGAYETRHRSRDSILWLERGLKVAPEDPGILSDLGQILLHQSRDEEGRAMLEKAYAMDPFDSRLSNTLNLLDDLKTWPTYRTEHFRYRVHPKEAELLGELLGKELERDWAEITALYGYEPRDRPIDVEMYPKQTDFAVRTIGQPNLGALGVCFGRFVAVDSPAVQKQVEPFHWGDVVRHEFTHVVTLQLSDFRVPRWLTEGLSVYSERFPRLPFDPMLKAAQIEGRILKMKDLNPAFSRPAYPGQVQLAYAQGGEIARFIAETRGFDAITRMLEAYRKGKRTEAVLKEVLGMSLDEFDRAFGADLAERLKSVQCIVPMSDEDLKKLEGAKPPPPGAPLALARQYLARRQWAKAERSARTAHEAGEATGEAAAILGVALRRQEKSAEAEPLLREAVAKRPDHYMGHGGLGMVLKGKGEFEEALKEFRLARRCYPHAAEGEGNPYRSEADCLFSLGRVDEGISVLRELCAMNGLDTQARLDLARALRDRGKREEALSVMDETLFGDVHTPAIHHLRAELLEAQGRPTEAKAAETLARSLEGRK